VASHVAYASEEVFRATKRIIQYLKCTKTLGMHFKAANKDDHVRAWVDASYMSAKDHHGYSRFGYCIKVADNIIEWKTAFLPRTASSTTAAEYHALALCAIEAINVGNIYKEMREAMASEDMESSEIDIKLGIDRKPEPHVQIYEDNKPAIAAAHSNKGSTLQTRQMAARFWQLREQVIAGTISIDAIPTALQIADFFTKKHAPKRFCELRKFFVRERFDTS